MSEPVVVYEPKAPEVLPAPHSLEENEQTIEQGLGTFVDVGRALMEIRDSRQYIQAGFDTFEAYCRQRWDMPRKTADMTIASAKVPAIAGIEEPVNEWTVRPLVKLLNEDGPDAVREAWKQILDRHQGNGPVTGREVRTFLNPSLGTSPSQRETSDVYLGALDKIRKGMESVRWALEAKRDKVTPNQVREQYALYAETVAALAETMQALADGEKFTLTGLHERLDVGVWDR